MIWQWQLSKHHQMLLIIGPGPGGQERSILMARKLSLSQCIATDFEEPEICHLFEICCPILQIRASVLFWWNMSRVVQSIILMKYVLNVHWFSTVSRWDNYWDSRQVSHVLASGHDLVIPWGSSESTGLSLKAEATQPGSQGSWPDPGCRPPLSDWLRLPRLMTGWEGQSIW